MIVEDGLIIEVDYVQGLGTVQLGSRALSFMLCHFVSGWPVCKLETGDKVQVRLSDDGMQVLSVRRDRFVGGKPKTEEGVEIIQDYFPRMPKKSMTPEEFCLKYASVLVVRRRESRLPTPTQEIRMECRGEDSWAVFYDGEMLGKDGKVSPDYLPSNRSDKDYTVRRFSFFEAMAVSLALLDATKTGWLWDWEEPVREAVLKALG